MRELARYTIFWTNTCSKFAQFKN